MEVFQIEAGVTSAGKWIDYLGIPRCCVLPASERPCQKANTDWMKKKNDSQSEAGSGFSPWCLIKIMIFKNAVLFLKSIRTI